MTVDGRAFHVACFWVQVNHGTSDVNPRREIFMLNKALGPIKGRGLCDVYDGCLEGQVQK